MGRAFYCFGHDVALRLPNGQAFALQNAELGADFGVQGSPICFLRGNFTAGTYRALIARGVIPPNPSLQALAQAVTVQLNLKPSWVATVCKDVATFNNFGRRLDLNHLTDEMARKALTFDEWQLLSARPLGKVGPSSPPAETQAATMDPAQEAAITEMVSEMASHLWLAAEEAGEAAQTPPLDAPMEMAEAIRLFFEEEAWGWEEVAGAEDLLRTIYDGQNGSWMCYTRILPGLGQVIFYSVFPVSVPTSAVSIMTEYLCRVNAELSLGNFEMDFSHNTIRFRTSVDVTDVGLAPLLFRNIVYQNLAVMDIYLLEMMGIVAGRRSALPLVE